MLKADRDIYDVIIIGAGIGGLVCGCYLAKAGMKVLIAEQHYKPGGYCTSFKRQGFTFDAAAHCFGGYRKDGITRKVFKDLEIDKRLKIKKFDPSNTIITPDYKISLWTDLDETIKDFQTAFPDKNNKFKDFFYFLNNIDPASCAHMRSLTFKNLLDKYFNNDKLKAILSYLLLSHGGLPASLMSFFIGATIFTEFLLDGGYYPEGGMQVLPDALAERFREFGGELLLSCPVKKIEVKDNKVAGVIIEKSDFIPSKFVISNCDARETFLKLLGKEKIGKEFYFKVKKMVPSISNFVLYLGLDKNFNFSLKPGTTLCFLPHYNLEKAYQAAQENIEDYGGYILRISYDKSTINAIMPAPYKNKMYWKNNKYKLLKAFIDRIEKFSLPYLSKHIVYKGAATPYTLYRYTRNYKGASYGWASIPSQLADPDFKKPSFIKGLYLTGHWTTQGMGIPGVTYIGYNTANLIIKRGQNGKKIV